MAGHTIFLPYGEDGEELRSGGPLIRPQLWDWCPPLPSSGRDRYNYRRAWSVYWNASDTEQDYQGLILFECLDNTISVQHQVEFQPLVETDLTNIQQMVGLFEPPTFTGRMTNAWIARDPLISRLPRVNGQRSNVWHEYTVLGVDRTVSWWMNSHEWEQMDQDMSQILLPVNKSITWWPIYVKRDFTLDTHRLMSLWAEAQSRDTPMNSVFVNQALVVSTTGGWYNEPVGRSEPMPEQMVAELESAPVKHRKLILDLKKSLVSEKWSS